MRSTLFSSRSLHSNRVAQHNADSTDTLARSGDSYSLSIRTNRRISSLRPVGPLRRRHQWDGNPDLLFPRLSVFIIAMRSVGVLCFPDWCEAYGVFSFKGVGFDSDMIPRAAFSPFPRGTITIFHAIPQDQGLRSHEHKLSILSHTYTAGRETSSVSFHLGMSLPPTRSSLMR